MTVRNHPALEHSQHVRATIRIAWLGLIRRQPFARHTARQVREALPAELAGLPERTVQWHMARLAAIDCARRNLSIKRTSA
ncbi:MAG: hypothetical protein ACREU3_10235 [Steroidobacteraceae bacterium]